jgi:hypothetical protein
VRRDYLERYGDEELRPDYRSEVASERAPTAA